MNQRGFQGWVNFDVSGSYIFLKCIMYLIINNFFFKMELLQHSIEKLYNYEQWFVTTDKKMSDPKKKCRQDSVVEYLKKWLNVWKQIRKVKRN